MKRKTLRKNWTLGFLGFLAFFAARYQDSKDPLELLWFLNVLWFIYFIPNSKK